jgi:copper chaperone CopZ
MMARMLRTIALAVACLLGHDDDTWTIAVKVEAMHCDECKAGLEANLKAIKDARVETEGTTVTVTVPEKVRVGTKTIAAALPSDLKLKSVTVTFRAVVTAKGERLDARAKDSGQTFALANLDDRKKDAVGELKKSLKDPWKYVVTGELVERQRVETVLLSAVPTATTWKDEK